MNDRDETQFFIDRAPSLLQLIDQLVDANLDGASCDEGSDEEKVHAEKAEKIHAEIEERLCGIQMFGGTEAFKIKRILDGVA